MGNGDYVSFNLSHNKWIGPSLGKEIVVIVCK